MCVYIYTLTNPVTGVLASNICCSQASASHSFLKPYCQTTAQICLRPEARKRLNSNPSVLPVLAATGQRGKASRSAGSAWPRFQLSLGAGRTLFFCRYLHARTHTQTHIRNRVHTYIHTCIRTPMHIHAYGEDRPKLLGMRCKLSSRRIFTPVFLNRPVRPASDARHREGRYMALQERSSRRHPVWHLFSTRRGQGLLQSYLNPGKLSGP